MQEQNSEKVVSMSVRATKVTANVLRFDRLLADEGIKIYTLIMAYKIDEHIQDEYVEHIISLSKKNCSSLPEVYA